jgi:hypothetical protein
MIAKSEIQSPKLMTLIKLLFVYNTNKCCIGLGLITNILPVVFPYDFIVANQIISWLAEQGGVCQFHTRI